MTDYNGNDDSSLPCYIDPECTSDQDKNLTLVSGYCAGKAYNEICKMLGGMYPDCKIMEQAPYAHKLFMHMFGVIHD